MSFVSQSRLELLSPPYQIFFLNFWEEAMPTIIIIVIFLMGKWGCHHVDNLSTLNCIKL